MAERRIWECSVGRFVGTVSEHCHQLRGIRYATSERYRPPVPYVYPDGVHEVCDRAPFGLQEVTPLSGYISGDQSDFKQEESCQYLSITLPEDIREGEALPVMFYIHGGFYRSGGCDSRTYHRETMVREQRLIIVGTNYRLGELGFTRDDEGHFVNLGLEDIICALQWVHDNIAFFGGDPANVTLWGQSAGGDAVRCVMLADGTDDLYARAIIQSDPIGTETDRGEQDRSILGLLGELLRNASLEALLRGRPNALTLLWNSLSRRNMPFVPRFGVKPLPDEAACDRRLREVAARHALLIGSNEREVSIFADSTLGVFGRVLLGLPQPLSVPVEALVRFGSDFVFAWPAENFAHRFAAYGGKAYLYRFCWSREGAPLSSCHSQELLALFGAVPGRTRASIMMDYSPEEVLAAGEPMRGIWAEFARTGSIAGRGVEGMLSVEAV